MLNDVIFNDEKSAYDDWNIVLTKADIPLPTPKISTVDILGADGILDLSEVRTGDILYNNRQIKLTFEMMDDRDYYGLVTEISNYLHGKISTIRLSNDDEYYYIGRLTVNQWECVKRKGKIVIQCDCEPYKYLVAETIKIVTVNKEVKTITLPNSRKRLCPMLNGTGIITLIIEGHNYKLTEGEQQLINFILVEGDNIIQVSGNGTLTITYRQGVL